MNNNTRANLGRAATEVAGGDGSLGSHVTDTLANLMHYCRRNGLDFEKSLERARMHYLEESMGQSK